MVFNTVQDYRSTSVEEYYRDHPPEPIDPSIPTADTSMFDHLHPRDPIAEALNPDNHL